MTDPEAREAIRVWVKVRRDGLPGEAGYGDGSPREFGMASIERTYDDERRHIWETTEERAERESRVPPIINFEIVNAVYKRFQADDKKLIDEYYLGQRNVYAQGDTVDRFIKWVMKA